VHVRRQRMVSLHGSGNVRHGHARGEQSGRRQGPARRQPDRAGAEVQRQSHRPAVSAARGAGRHVHRARRARRHGERRRDQGGHAVDGAGDPRPALHQGRRQGPRPHRDARVLRPRVSDLLQPVLARYWGYTTFRPLQHEAMDAVLAGRDSIVVLPTGGGKSLCFQAPALVRDGLAVVVSPLISLMKDQVDTLTGNGVPAVLYNSSLAPEEKSAVIAGLRQGRYRLLYVSPERLVGDGGDGFLSMLRSCGVSFVAVDEAHCISQWGHDFRPEYRQLARLRDLLPGVSLHAFTATATARVRRDIASQLALQDPVELVGGFDRPNLVYRVIPRGTLKKQLVEILERHRGDAGIIYCTSRKEVDALAEWLTTIGVKALPYHAGLSDRERSRNQDAFLTERADV